MNKLFSKIAALSVGLAMAVGVGVAVNHGDVKVEKASAADSAFMVFDFEDETAHRTSGSNNYGVSGNVYSQHDSTISLVYADSVTSGTPISGSANITARIAKNTTNSPSIVIGPIDLSNYSLSAYSYKVKGVNSITIASSYSLDGTNWNSGESAVGPGGSNVATRTKDSLTISEESSFYLKITATVASSTGSNRDIQLDDITLIGSSTGSKPLDYITCPDQSMNVLENANLANQITFSPTDAANKAVSYSIKSGSDYIELSEQGVITGIKGGSAVVTITPDDTNADPIDVNVTVTSLPAPGVTIGNQYVIYAVDEANSKNFELTGVASNVGTASEFAGDVPSCSYVLTVEEGYFENTVAFGDGSKYLSLNSAGNNLHTSNEVNANASWVVEWDSSTNAATIKNAAFPNRLMKYNYNSGNPRFACYASGQTEVCLYEYHESALVDFSLPETAEVYRTATVTIVPTYNPADAYDKVLNWKSSDENIATVNENGVVTGVSVGECVICASKVIGGINVERFCTVTVLNNVSEHRGTEADPFNIADAVQVAKGIFSEDPDGTPIDLSNEYYVFGMITSAVNRTLNKVTVWLGDNASQTSAATGGFEVYQSIKIYGQAIGEFYNEKADKDVAADFAVGYFLLVKSTLTVYNGTPETTNNKSDIVWNNYIDARLYAEAFNSSLSGVCDAEGDTNLTALVTVWGNQASEFDGLDALSQALLTDAQAKTTSSASAVELCAAKYDYIAGKYNVKLGAEYDFMGRDPELIQSSFRSDLSISDNNNLVIIITVIASVSVLSLGVLIALKKKKHN